MLRQWPCEGESVAAGRVRRIARRVPRFRLDNLAPVAGSGVVAGSAAQGERLVDAVIGLEALRRRVPFD